MKNLLQEVKKSKVLLFSVGGLVLVALGYSIWSSVTVTLDFKTMSVQMAEYSVPDSSSLVTAHELKKEFEKMGFQDVRIETDRRLTIDGGSDIERTLSQVIIDGQPAVLGKTYPPSAKVRLIYPDFTEDYLPVSVGDVVDPVSLRDRLNQLGFTAVEADLLTDRQRAVMKPDNIVFEFKIGEEVFSPTYSYSFEKIPVFYQGKPPAKHQTSWLNSEHYPRYYHKDTPIKLTETIREILLSVNDLQEVMKKFNKEEMVAYFQLLGFESVSTEPVSTPYQEKAGVVEKVFIKGNPIFKDGETWSQPFFPSDEVTVYYYEFEKEEVPQTEPSSSTSDVISISLEDFIDKENSGDWIEGEVYQLSGVIKEISAFSGRVGTSVNKDYISLETPKQPNSGYEILASKSEASKFEVGDRVELLVTVEMLDDMLWPVILSASLE